MKPAIFAASKQPQTQPIPMSKFFKLNMANEVARNPHVVIRHHLFGMLTSVLYSPTQSPIESYSNYYDKEQGEFFLQLINSSDGHLSEAIGNAHDIEVQPQGGCYRLDLCLSSDHRFIALQLNEVQGQSQRPLTPIRYFEGDQAELIENLFA